MNDSHDPVIEGGGEGISTDESISTEEGDGLGIFTEEGVGG